MKPKSFHGLCPRESDKLAQTTPTAHFEWHQLYCAWQAGKAMVTLLESTESHMVNTMEVRAVCVRNSVCRSRVLVALMLASAQQFDLMECISDFNVRTDVHLCVNMVVGQVQHDRGT